MERDFKYVALIETVWRLMPHVLHLAKPGIPQVDKKTGGSTG